MTNCSSTSLKQKIRLVKFRLGPFKKFASNIYWHSNCGRNVERKSNSEHSSRSGLRSFLSVASSSEIRKNPQKDGALSAMNAICKSKISSDIFLTQEKPDSYT